MLGTQTAGKVTDLRCNFPGNIHISGKVFLDIYTSEKIYIRKYRSGIYIGSDRCFNFTRMISLGYRTLNHRYLWFSQINLYKWLLPIIAFTLEDQRWGILGETANSLRNALNPFLSKMLLLPLLVWLPRQKEINFLSNQRSSAKILCFKVHILGRKFLLEMVSILKWFDGLYYDSVAPIPLYCLKYFLDLFWLGSFFPF